MVALTTPTVTVTPGWEEQTRGEHQRRSVAERGGATAERFAVLLARCAHGPRGRAAAACEPAQPVAKATIAVVVARVRTVAAVNQPEGVEATATTAVGRDAGAGATDRQAAAARQRNRFTLVTRESHAVHTSARQARPNQTGRAAAPSALVSGMQKVRSAMVRLIITLSRG